MVIGGGESEHLADALLSELIFAHSLKLSWVFQSTNTDNAALSLGQSRNRVNCSDATWVR